MNKLITYLNNNFKYNNYNFNTWGYPENPSPFPKYAEYEVIDGVDQVKYTFPEHVLVNISKSIILVGNVNVDGLYSNYYYYKKNTNDPNDEVYIDGHYNQITEDEIINQIDKFYQRIKNKC
jgi:hypothetical protein